MRLSPIVLVLGSFLAVACTTEPKVDSSGLVSISSPGPGRLYAHPDRSIDDYDDILLGDVRLAYASQEQRLSDQDTHKLRMRTFEIVTKQIPAAGQLAAPKASPCTVELGVQLAKLELPKPGSRAKAATTVILEFRDSLNGDPIVRYEQHRELSVSTDETEPELERIGRTLEIVADDVRVNLRDALPLKGGSARAAQGCKGTIGIARAQTKAGKASAR